MARLKILDRFDSPVREASGLCCFDLDGAEQLAVVGDRDSVLAWAPITPDGPGQWRTLALTELPGAPADVGQLEAVAAAGDGRVVVLGEEPALLVLVDVAGSVIEGWWHISTAESPDFAQLWDRDDNSRGEGLQLLPDGHALVIKEKDPVVIVEVGPDATRASLDWQSMPATWDAPAGHSLRPVHWLDIDSAPGDLSDCEVVDGVLYAISDQDRCLVQLRHDQESLVVGESWKLDEKVEKPEGLAVTAGREWYVAMDTGNAAGAIVRIRPPGNQRPLA